ncbi:hypothetical protein EYF80_000551 [Liparis tanakae]|uniref:Uncharacterized protein n=1 Tax=Liparis tanakae TaxID=230148 RepID=A0A4Z2JHH7_9TELE|nr:hypothetical protein EYF80_000551 [Liparis tanakae]
MTPACLVGVYRCGGRAIHPAVPRAGGQEGIRTTWSEAVYSPASAADGKRRLKQNHTAVVAIFRAFFCISSGNRVVAPPQRRAIFPVSELLTVGMDARSFHLRVTKLDTTFLPHFSRRSAGFMGPPPPRCGYSSTNTPQREHVSSVLQQSVEDAVRQLHLDKQLVLVIVDPLGFLLVEFLNLGDKRSYTAVGLVLRKQEDSRGLTFTSIMGRGNDKELRTHRTSGSWLLASLPRYSCDGLGFGSCDRATVLPDLLSSSMDHLLHLGGGVGHDHSRLLRKISGTEPVFRVYFFAVNKGSNVRPTLLAKGNLVHVRDEDGGWCIFKIQHDVLSVAIKNRRLGFFVMLRIETIKERVLILRGVRADLKLFWQVGNLVWRSEDAMALNTFKVYHPVISAVVAPLRLIQLHASPEAISEAGWTFESQSPRLYTSDENSICDAKTWHFISNRRNGWRVAGINNILAVTFGVFCVVMQIQKSHR